MSSGISGDAWTRTGRPPPRSEIHALLGIASDMEAAPTVRLVSGPRRLDGVLLQSLVLTGPQGYDVPCLYLTPESPPPWPGVVAVHQHNAEFRLGKSEPTGLAGSPDMAYGIAMAHLGVATVVPDLCGFEDRQGPPGGLQDADYERLEAFHLLAVGSSLQARHVQDVALTVSFLAAQGDVTGRIGVIGHSLGGQVGFFAAACDSRIQSAVLSCGVGTIESFYRTSTRTNPAWYVPGILTFGDIPAIAAAAVDQRFWISAGSQDPLFPMDGVERVASAFPPGSTQLHVFGGGHGFPPEVQQPATRWLAASLGALLA